MEAKAHGVPQPVHVGLMFHLRNRVGHEFDERLLEKISSFHDTFASGRTMRYVLSTQDFCNGDIDAITDAVRISLQHLTRSRVFFSKCTHIYLSAAETVKRFFLKIRNDKRATICRVVEQWDKYECMIRSKCKERIQNAEELRLSAKQVSSAIETYQRSLQNVSVKFEAGKAAYEVRRLMYQKEATLWEAERLKRMAELKELRQAKHKPNPLLAIMGVSEDKVAVANAVLLLSVFLCTKPRLVFRFTPSVRDELVELAQQITLSQQRTNREQHLSDKDNLGVRWCSIKNALRYRYAQRKASLLRGTYIQRPLLNARGQPVSKGKPAGGNESALALEEQDDYDGSAFLANIAQQLHHHKDTDHEDTTDGARTVNDSSSMNSAHDHDLALSPSKRKLASASLVSPESWRPRNNASRSTEQSPRSRSPHNKPFTTKPESQVPSPMTNGLFRPRRTSALVGKPVVASTMAIDYYRSSVGSFYAPFEPLPTYDIVSFTIKLCIMPGNKLEFVQCRGMTIVTASPHLLPPGFAELWSLDDWTQSQLEQLERDFVANGKRALPVVEVSAGGHRSLQSRLRYRESVGRRGKADDTSPSSDPASPMRTHQRASFAASIAGESRAHLHSGIEADLGLLPNPERESVKRRQSLSFESFYQNSFLNSEHDLLRFADSDPHGFQPLGLHYESQGRSQRHSRTGRASRRRPSSIDPLTGESIFAEDRPGFGGGYGSLHLNTGRMDSPRKSTFGTELSIRRTTSRQLSLTRQCSDSAIASPRGRTKQSQTLSSVRPSSPRLRASKEEDTSFAGSFAGLSRSVNTDGPGSPRLRPGSPLLGRSRLVSGSPMPRTRSNNSVQKASVSERSLLGGSSSPSRTRSNQSIATERPVSPIKSEPATFALGSPVRVSSFLGAGSAALDSPRSHSNSKLRRRDSCSKTPPKLASPTAEVNPGKQFDSFPTECDTRQLLRPGMLITHVNGKPVEETDSELRIFIGPCTLQIQQRIRKTTTETPNDSLGVFKWPAPELLISSAESDCASPATSAKDANTDRRSSTESQESVVCALISLHELNKGSVRENAAKIVLSLGSPDLAPEPEMAAGPPSGVGFGLNKQGSCIARRIPLQRARRSPCFLVPEVHDVENESERVLSFTKKPSILQASPHRPVGFSRGDSLLTGSKTSEQEQLETEVALSQDFAGGQPVTYGNEHAALGVEAVCAKCANTADLGSVATPEKRKERPGFEEVPIAVNHEPTSTCQYASLEMEGPKLAFDELDDKCRAADVFEVCESPVANSPVPKLNDLSFKNMSPSWSAANNSTVSSSPAQVSQRVDLDNSPIVSPKRAVQFRIGFASPIREASPSGSSSRCGLESALVSHKAAQRPVLPLLPARRGLPRKLCVKTEAEDRSSQSAFVNEVGAQIDTCALSPATQSMTSPKSTGSERVMLPTPALPSFIGRNKGVTCQPSSLSPLRVVVGGSGGVQLASPSETRERQWPLKGKKLHYTSLNKVSKGSLQTPVHKAAVVEHQGPEFYRVAQLAAVSKTPNAAVQDRHPLSGTPSKPSFTQQHLKHIYCEMMHQSLPSDSLP
ncbi:hypothetical protein DIPPA_61633 [Diplonema papillatum]|nr:hypothetical protein DIPPA_61633 [Diplonema papillatum]